MTVTHVGATKQYVSGWENIFGKSGGGQGGKSRAAAKKGKPKSKPATKKKGAGKKAKR